MSDNSWGEISAGNSTSESPKNSQPAAQNYYMERINKGAAPIENEVWPSASLFLKYHKKNVIPPKYQLTPSPNISKVVSPDLPPIYLKKSPVTLRQKSSSTAVINIYVSEKQVYTRRPSYQRTLEGLGVYSPMAMAPPKVKKQSEAKNIIRDSGLYAMDLKNNLNVNLRKRKEGNRMDNIQEGDSEDSELEEEKRAERKAKEEGWIHGKPWYGDFIDQTNKKTKLKNLKQKMLKKYVSENNKVIDYEKQKRANNSNNNILGGQNKSQPHYTSIQKLGKASNNYRDPLKEYMRKSPQNKLPSVAKLGGISVMNAIPVRNQHSRFKDSVQTYLSKFE